MKMSVIFQMKNYDKLTKAETMLSKGIEWFEVYEEINTTQIFLFKFRTLLPKSMNLKATKENYRLF